MGNAAQGIANAVEKVDHPEEKLKVYINCIAANVDKNPELPPIMMREIAADGAHLPLVVIEDIVSVLTVLAGILEEGRKKGIFADVGPFIIHMMIVGTILFYKKALPIKDRQSWLPATIKARDKKLKAGLGEEVATLVLKAIKR
jgi:hypothetical protein